MSSTPVRRSARAPKPNPRYEDEVPWNNDTVRLLRYDSNSSDRSSTAEDSQTHIDQDVEMQDVREDEESEEEERVSLHHNRSFTNDLQTPSLPVSDEEVPVLTKHKSAKTSFRLSKKEVYPQIFGPSVEDLYPILQTRDIWHIHPRDVVFPSRASLREAIRLHANGEYLEQGQKKEKAALNEDYQQAEQITREQALTGKYLENGETHNVVLGPSDKPQQYTIQYQNSFQVARAFHRPLPGGMPSSSTDIDDAYQKGWILNLGQRPTCLAWAPGSTDDQFLAVTFRCSKSQRNKAPPPQTKLAPAFSLSPAYPSRIEIWRIKARSVRPEEPCQLDHHTPPKLVQVVCVKYGNILKMEWLSAVRKGNEHSLCVLTTDGNIRVLHLSLTDTEIPIYLRIDQPQLIADAPTNTVFTSFTPPNSQDLIAADATGAIHLFSLISKSRNLTPYATIQIHVTYIMSLSSIPSHPQFICTSSAAGEYILTDLRSPSIDRVRVQTARLPTRNLAYLPFTRTFLTTLDSSGRFESTSFTGSTVVSHNLRDFKLAKPVLRLPDTGGIATCLATSPFHPIIAIGNASGSVFTSNYVRRCLPIANARTGVGAWIVKLFGYEWRALTRDETAERVRRKGMDDNDVEVSKEGRTQAQRGSTSTEDDALLITPQQKGIGAPHVSTTGSPHSVSSAAPDTTLLNSHLTNIEQTHSVTDTIDTNSDVNTKSSTNETNDNNTTDATTDPKEAPALDHPGSDPTTLPPTRHQDTATDTAEGKDMEIDIYHGPSTPRPGISRISDSFRPYKVIVSKLENARAKGTARKINGKGKGKGTGTTTGRGHGRPKKKRKRDSDEDVDVDVDIDEDDGRSNGVGNTHQAYATRNAKQANVDEEGQGPVIYHEEQAVSCLAWNGTHVTIADENVDADADADGSKKSNGNVRFASWLAIGWGSGIVRIVDLGHDVV